VTRAAETSYVAECFWSGVRESDLVELDSRIERSVAECAGAGDPVRYLGSMLIVDDEVVLCLFEGPLTTVRQVAERAGVPFDRILRSTRAPWSPPGSDPGPE
jgi:hypothetical protein